MAIRTCHDCGSTNRETPFAGTHKPYKRRDRCVECAADPLAEANARVAVRRAEIAVLRAAGRYRVPKPFHTAPLFAGLRVAATGVR